MTAGLAGQGLEAALCLGVVLLLIIGAARAVRAMPALRIPAWAAIPAESSLALRGSLALDRQRRLHLVEADGCRTLVLTGGGADVMVLLPKSP